MHTIDRQYGFYVAQVCCHHNCGGLGPRLIFERIFRKYLSLNKGNLYEQETDIFWKGD